MDVFDAYAHMTADRFAAVDCESMSRLVGFYENMSLLAELVNRGNGNHTALSHSWNQVAAMFKIVCSMVSPAVDNNIFFAPGNEKVTLVDEA